ncbi:Acyl transferase domain-containing protein [Amycolatopsis xylanica]|uniref:Acyl transferase domain-containing protein n=1 Tax=Amycolatopsis xylanica TaxID=589385 RepID=A0A1H3PF76_9PSEU|nr:acyltransferase domain-containing protein [Amycolatopsis xylanica]SDY99740.1 Acyl transferase domain-containing protein [Amycolatopsis xylanica]
MPRKIAILFPGQGAQHHSMGTGLYGTEPVFTAAMDAFFDAPGHAGATLREEWLAPEQSALFDDVSRAQPLLFALGCALAAMVRAHGVEPDALLGHSVGELSAACTADVFSLADSGKVMRARIDAVAKTVPGGMLAVATDPERIAPYLTPAVVIGAVNTPRQLLLSGPAAELAEVAARLSENGFACQPARSEQAFHSPACALAAKEFAEGFRDVTLSAPKVRIQSTGTGSPVTDQEALDPDFWARQLAHPVLFWSALDNLLTEGDDYLLLEAGPGGSCSAMARRHPALKSKRSTLLPLLPNAGGDPAAALDLVRAAITVAHA